MSSCNSPSTLWSVHPFVALYVTYVPNSQADIPKRTCMGNAILEKFERLDDIDMKILNVSCLLFSFHNLNV